MRTRLVAGLGVVLAGLALSACGQRLPADQRLAAAQQATSEADTARMAMEFASEMGGDGAGMDMTVVGDGEVDFAAEQAALELEVPGRERAVTVIDGDVVYIRTQSAAGNGDEVRWRRHDDTVGGAEMLFRAGMDGAPDPTTLLSALGGADGAIAELGADEIRGEPVDGFGFTTDAATLAGDAEVDDDVAGVAVDMEAWLDAANRVRRLTATVALAELAAADSPDGEVPDDVADGHITVTLELFDFGADVRIDVPADDDVIDPTEPTSAPELEATPAPEAEPPEGDAIERKATAPSTEAEVEAEPAQPAEPAKPRSDPQASPAEPPSQTPAEDGS